MRGINVIRHLTDADLPAAHNLDSPFLPVQHNPGSTNLTSPSDQSPVFDGTTDHDMERCTRNTRELQSQLAVVLPARWPLSCPQLPCPGHTPPSPDRPEPLRIRVPARTGSTIVASKGCAVTLGSLGSSGSLDEDGDGEAVLDLSCGHTMPWPLRSTVSVWRRSLAHNHLSITADQSGQAVVSRRDVELATRSRVKMVDVAICVTTTHPAKWLLAPVEGRHTSNDEM